MGPILYFRLQPLRNVVILPLEVHLGHKLLRDRRPIGSGRRLIMVGEGMSRRGDSRDISPIIVSAPQMMGELGPLIMVVQFVGFMAGWNSPGALSALGGAVVASLVATYFIFHPCFLFTFPGAT
jgi:hypothetical protein